MLKVEIHFHHYTQMIYCQSCRQNEVSAVSWSGIHLKLCRIGFDWCEERISGSTPEQRKNQKRCWLCSLLSESGKYRGQIPQDQ